MVAIKAIIFDMDGVLIDAKQWHYEALNLALKPHGFEISEDEHIRTYDGLPTRKKLELLSRRKGLDESKHDEIHALKQAYTIDTIQSKCQPNPAHLEVVKALKAEGYLLCVCTNSVRRTTQLILSLAGLEPYLEFSLTSDEVRVPKPSPEIYEAAMERLGVSAAETLIFEDNPYGIQAARASGAKVALVSEPSDINLNFIQFHLSRLGNDTSLLAPNWTEAPREGRKPNLHD